MYSMYKCVTLRDCYMLFDEEIRVIWVVEKAGFKVFFYRVCAAYERADVCPSWPGRNPRGGTNGVMRFRARTLPRYHMISGSKDSHLHRVSREAEQMTSYD